MEAAPDMSEAYWPGPETLAAVTSARAAALIGPSAVGKTTVLERAQSISPDIYAAVSDTSRAPRSSEVDGIDYNFHSETEMQSIAHRGEYVNFARNPTGDLYAYRLSEYMSGKITVLPIVSSRMPVMRQLPFQELHSIFMVPPSVDVWQERLAGRFSDEQLVKRLDEARTSLQYGLEDDQTKYVVNATVNQAANDLLTFLYGVTPDERLAEDQGQARHIMSDMLERAQAMQADIS